MTPDNPVVTIENRVFVGNGEMRWMQFVNRGFFDADGSLMETQSVGRDITQLKKTELDLRESEEMLQRAQAVARIGSFVTDGNPEVFKHTKESALRESDERLELALEGAGLVLWDWDIAEGKVTPGKRWFELLGFTNEELGNDIDDWMALTNPKDLERVTHNLSAHFQGETASFESEHQLRHKDGHWVSIEARGRVPYEIKTTPFCVWSIQYGILASASDSIKKVWTC